MDKAVQELRAALVGEGGLTAEAFGRAEEYARRNHISVDRALIVLQETSCESMGRALARYHRMPYVPLLQARADPDAVRMYSRICTSRWQAFPLSYDARLALTTLAVPTPGHATMLERLHRFLMLEGDLAFAVAPRVEIESALENVSMPKPRAIEEARRDAAAKRRGVRDPSATQPYPRVRMVNPLAQRQRKVLREVDLEPFIIMASQNVSAGFAGQRGRLSAIRRRVRYCQLLSTRVGLNLYRSQRVVLAAWLSSYDDSRDAIRRLGNPGDVLEILHAGPRQVNTVREGRVLSLVTRYQAVLTDGGSAISSNDALRNRLADLWVGDDDDLEILDEFVHLLRDERFLAKAALSSGRILVVDPTECSTPAWTPPLLQDGYDVEAVSTLAAGQAAMQAEPPDLLLAVADLPDGSGLDLCRALKSANASAHTLVILEPAGERSKSDCLRMGADDVIERPVSHDAVSARIRQWLAVPRRGEQRSGVHGELGQIGFTDMVQIFSAGGRSLEIEVERAGVKGRMVMQRGEIIHSELGERQGTEALLELLSWSDGSFDARPCSEFPARTVEGSTTGLLMEAARVQDEASG